MYIKLIDNVVVQKQPNKEDGFIEVDNSIICGMIKTQNGFENLVVTKSQDELKEEFKQNRTLIMNSIGWIHERIQSQTVLIQGGKTLTASYTTAQAIEYYDYKQALRDRPSIITDWTSISYPVVPQHVYDDMTESIKLLCQELQCDPVV